MKRMKKYLLFLVTVCLLAACSDDNSIPKGKSSLKITAASIEDFNYAESRTFEVKLQNVSSTAIKQPEGWNTSLKDGILTVIDNDFCTLFPIILIKLGKGLNHGYDTHPSGSGR